MGILLLVLAVFGIVYGSRASLAQAFYFQAKYGAHAEYPRRVIRRCEIAHRYYPYNYLFCIWASEKSWYNRMDLSGRERPEWIESAMHWCNQGLELNYYKSQLRMLKARLLRRDSARKAALYWEEYVEWQFWDQYNHAVLVGLYADAGDFGKALKELEWIEGSEYYVASKIILDEAWAKEMTLEPPVVLGDQGSVIRGQ